jgi:bifunctional non-homologous end joining protein LigD
VHEIKFDGYRTQAHLRQEHAAIYTRAGYDWTQHFQPIVDALAALPAHDLMLDGEALVANSRRVPDFKLLHADLAADRKDRLQYFDGLYLNGSNLRGAWLAKRKLRRQVTSAGLGQRVANSWRPAVCQGWPRRADRDRIHTAY